LYFLETSKFSFLSTNYIYLLLPTATVHEFLNDLTLCKPSTWGFRAVGFISTSSTLSRLQQWVGSYLTYCRPTGDGSSYYVVLLRLVDDDHTP